MGSAKPIPLRPVNVGALLEAAEASGLPDEVVALMLDRLFPESLVADWVADPKLVRRAINTPTLRLLAAVKEVDDEQDDEPAWPPPLIEGEPVELPGFSDVPERPAEKGRTWTA